MNQSHIDCGAAPNGEEHLAEFEMQQDRCNDAGNFWQAMAAVQKGGAFETVDDEHAKDRSRENIAEVADDGRCRLLL